MTTYTWSCLYCGASNSPSSRCASCGFPDEASAEEIDLARAKGVAEVFRLRAERENAQAEWKKRPLWRRTILPIALVLSLTGAILAKFAPPIELNVLGALIGLVGMVLLYTATRYK